jgi:hypothetical protein
MLNNILPIEKGSLVHSVILFGKKGFAQSRKEIAKAQSLSGFCILS